MILINAENIQYYHNINNIYAGNNCNYNLCKKCCDECNIDIKISNYNYEDEYDSTNIYKLNNIYKYIYHYNKKIPFHIINNIMHFLMKN